jgi:hypothetical protein
MAKSEGDPVDQQAEGASFTHPPCPMLSRGAASTASLIEGGRNLLARQGWKIEGEKRIVDHSKFLLLDLCGCPLAQENHAEYPWLRLSLAVL